jgi:methanogenic corrinoid protein MtbC1
MFLTRLLRASTVGETAGPAKPTNMTSNDQTDAAIHPIGVAAERAGVSPDVVRAWERRYGVVEPERDASGRRVYTQSDIDRLVLLARATEGGRSIGQVAKLQDEVLRELIRQRVAARAAAGMLDPGADSGALVQEGMRLVRALDGHNLEVFLLHAASRHGVPVLLRTLVGPLFREIGVEWHAGRLTPAQEHLATTTVRGVIVRLLGTLPRIDDAPVLLAATPAGERHEIGILMVVAEAVTLGWRVTYLGADLPAAEIASAAEQTGARAVALGAVYAPDPGSLVREISALRRALSEDIALIVGGAAVRFIDLPEGDGRTLYAGDLDELRTELMALA